MAYNRFRIGVVLRVGVIVSTLFLILVLYQNTDYLMTIGILALIAIYQVFSLVRFVERTERDLTRFLQAIQYEDFFETFGTRAGPSAKRLHAEFTRIMQDFRNVRSQREEQFLYLQTILQHIGIVLLSYDQEGEIELVNPAARRLFKVNRIKHIRHLERFSPALVKALQSIQPGEKKTVRVTDENELLLLSVHATEFHRGTRRLTLATIQNIRSELEEKELEAWQNLIRVLTHEIRNSITPITSLASTTVDLLAQVHPATDEDREQIEDVNLAIGTIQNRGKGLLNFVEAFRSLYKVPKPNFTQLSVQDFFQHLQTFFDVSMEQRSICLSFECSPDTLQVTVDPDLIEQVLINLITNAMQALDGMEGGRIEVSANIDTRGRARIQVVDNGPGIPEEEIDRVFIPFYTTKSDGTGIGLSLSRQILRLHKGSISVHSIPSERTVFTLNF
ncbi:ATP-binding protein [bacterium]|nr:ATP-binding protein [bacterium]